MGIARVLLVDDEVPFVEAMVKRLKIRGFEVYSAFSGLEALELLASKKNVEVIVLDVKMPDMDGVETLKVIKQRYPLIEVVMLTGHATVQSAVQGLKTGAYDYLMKPCNTDELVEKIKEAAGQMRKNEESQMADRLKELSNRFE